MSQGFVFLIGIPFGMIIALVLKVGLDIYVDGRIDRAIKESK